MTDSQIEELMACCVGIAEYERKMKNEEEVGPWISCREVAVELTLGSCPWPGVALVGGSADSVSQRSDSS